MAEKTIDLRGLKCPLPALRTRKALTTLKSGDLLVVECTDPLTTIDIPNLLNQTGDKLEGQSKEKKVLISLVVRPRPDSPSQTGVNACGERAGRS